MRITTLLATLLLLAGAAVGCTSSGDDDPKPAATTTVTATPTVTPSLSQAETARLCSVAVADAAPGWEDWNFAPGGWENDPRTPAVCQGLADAEVPSRGNRAFMAALIDGLEMADDPRARS